MTDRGLARLGALMLLASGCASEIGDAPAVVFDPCATTVTLAPDATAAEAAAVDDAIARWNEAAGLTLSRTDDPSREALPLRFEATLPALLGAYEADIGAILVNRALEDHESRTVVVMHELGHAFGLDHVPVEAEASLMNPANRSVPPTAADVARLHARWGVCRPGTSDD